MNNENIINVNDMVEQARLNKIQSIVKNDECECVDMFFMCIEDSLNKLVEL